MYSRGPHRATGKYNQASSALAWREAQAKTEVSFLSKWVLLKNEIEINNNNKKKPFVEDFIITSKRFIFMELFKNHEIENKPALDVG